MTDIEVGQEVRVLPIGLTYNQDAPPGGWVGRIVKITPKQVHIEYGDRPRTDVFSREHQTTSHAGIYRRFRTLPQVEEYDRSHAAMRVLRERNIKLDPRDFTLEQVEALAEVVKTWEG